MKSNFATPSDSTESRSGRLTVILFALSLFLHLAAVIVIHHYRHPLLWENGEIAHYLYEGKGFRIDYFGLTGYETSIQAPGYPVVLWGAYKLFGETPTAYLLVSFLSCLAVASMVWPMGWLSRRFFPDLPPWIAQALVVVYPLYVWYCTRLHHTALVMAVHPWLLWTWLEWCRRGPLQAIGTGILAAVAGLFQPVLLGAYAIIGAALLAGALYKRQWKFVANLLLAALAVILCLVPWTIRNYRVQGRLVLVKSGMAKEFWMGNNPHATGTSFAAGGAEEITAAFPPKAYALCGKVSEIALMDALDAEAWAYIKANPQKTVEMTLRKILWFWTVAPSNLVRSSQEGESLAYRSIDIIYWFTIAGLALLGVVTSKRPVREYVAVFAVYIVVYSAVYGMTHVGQARFRGEIEFVFLFGTAAGLHFVWTLFFGGRARHAS